VVTHSAPRVPDGTGEHPPAATASGAEGARRVLAVLQAFSPQRHTLTARELAKITGIPLPSMYRYIALLRDTGLLASDDRGAYHLTPQIVSLARAAEAAKTLIEIADPAGGGGTA
jgi:DNA-binding IclR family transcriptional regulator